jgi:hypothetical protein
MVRVALLPVIHHADGGSLRGIQRKWALVMKVADLVQMVSLGAVFCALLVSAVQTRILARQNAALSKSLSQGAYGSVARTGIEMRETFFLDDPEMLKWHLRARGLPCTDSQLQNKMYLYVLVKLDAHEGHFLDYKNGLLGDSIWLAWRRVIESDMSVDEFQRAWPAARHFYEETFVHYIDGLMHERADVEQRNAVIASPQRSASIQDQTVPAKT